MVFALKEVHMFGYELAELRSSTTPPPDDAGAQQKRTRIVHSKSEIVGTQAYSVLGEKPGDTDANQRAKRQVSCTLGEHR